MAIIAAAALLLVFVGCTREARRDRHLKRADLHYAAKEYDQAQIEYRNVLQLDPMCAAAIRGLGLTYYERGQYVRSIPYFLNVEALAPDDLLVRAKLGQIFLIAQRMAEAREEALAILNRAPTNAAGLLLLVETPATVAERELDRQLLDAFQRNGGDPATLRVATGLLHLQQRDLEAAEKDFRQALTLNAGFSKAHLALGHLCLLRGQTEEADGFFRKAAELLPVASPERVQWAEFKLRSGALDDGRKILEDLTTQAPDFLPAWSQLAAIALDQKRFEECEKLIERVLQRDASDFGARLLRARLRGAQGQLPAAVSELKTLVSAYPKSAYAHYELAQALLSMNEVTQGMDSLRQVTLLDTNHVNAIRKLAELNLRRGDLAEALRALEPLAKQNPKDWPTQLLLAEAYRARGNWEAALQVYRRLSELFPDRPQFFFFAGVTYRQQNKLPQARDAFAKVLAMSPDYLPAVNELVEMDLLTTNYPAAATRVESLVAKSPQSPEIRLMLAKVRLAERKYDQAEAALLKTLELDSNFVSAQALLAQLYVAMQRKDAAIARLEAILAREPANVSALVQIAMIEEKARNYTAAAQAYEKALAAVPDAALVLNNLASIYTEHLGQLAKGYELARKARQLLPDNPLIADTLGWIHLKQGDYAQALPLLQEAADKLPSQPVVLFHLGKARYMMAEEQPALVALQRAVQTSADFNDKEEALRLLAMLKAAPNKTDAETIAELEKRTDDPVALTRLAALHEKAGRLEKAKAAYARVLSLNPKALPAMVRLAELQAAEPGERKNALELAREARLLAREDVAVMHSLGRVAYQAGDPAWGLSLLEMAALKAPQRPQVQFDLALCYYVLGRVPDARKAMQRALDSREPFPGTNAAGHFLVLVGLAEKPDALAQAEAQINDALQSQPGYLPALHAQGLLEKQRGKSDRARQLFEAILKDHPLFTPAMRNLAVLYADAAGNDDKAYDLALKAQRADPNDAELTATLGALHCRRGEYALAARLLERCAEQRKEDPKVHYYLGLAHAQLKKKEEAKAELKRALELNLQGALAEDAKRLLLDLERQQ